MLSTRRKRTVLGARVPDVAVSELVPPSTGSRHLATVMATVRRRRIRDAKYCGPKREPWVSPQCRNVSDICLHRSSEMALLFTFSVNM